MIQDRINQEEWRNPDNWGGPDWIGVYFSKKDSRTWVPHKRFPRLGWTQNLAHRSGVYWLYGIIVGLTLFPVLICVAILTTERIDGAWAEKDSKPPRVVRTFPLNESRDVDPALTEISVTFNEEMRNHNWSWVHRDKAKFPAIIGRPYYTEDNRTNILPVSLEPNKEYVIRINSSKFRNFKDRSGNSAFPFKFTFRTGQSQQAE